MKRKLQALDWSDLEAQANATYECDFCKSKATTASRFSIEEKTSPPTYNYFGDTIYTCDKHQVCFLSSEKDNMPDKNGFVKE